MNEGEKHLHLSVPSVISSSSDAELSSIFSIDSVNTSDKRSGKNFDPNNRSSFSDLLQSKIKSHSNHMCNVPYVNSAKSSNLNYFLPKAQLEKRHVEVKHMTNVNSVVRSPSPSRSSVNPKSNIFNPKQLASSSKSVGSKAVITLRSRRKLKRSFKSLIPHSKESLKNVKFKKKKKLSEIPKGVLCDEGVFGVQDEKSQKIGLREERLSRLKQKSATTLLRDLFAQRRSKQLVELECTILGFPRSILEKVVHFDLEFVGCATKEMYLIVKSLLQSGADPGKCNADGLSALFMALHYERSLPIIHVLLEKGADINQLNILQGYEVSPLDLALKMGNPDTVKILLQKGALPSYSGKKVCKVKLSSFSRVNGFVDLALEVLQDVMWEAVHGNQVRLLKNALAHGARVDATDKTGRTPLFLSIQEKKNYKIQKLLLKAKADPNKRDASLTHMLCFPIMRSGNDAYRTVRALLKYKANPNERVGSEGSQLLVEFANEVSVCRRVKRSISRGDQTGFYNFK